MCLYAHLWVVVCCNQPIMLRNVFMTVWSTCGRWPALQGLLELFNYFYQDPWKIPLKAIRSLPSQNLLRTGGMKCQREMRKLPLTGTFSQCLMRYRNTSDSPVLLTRVLPNLKATHIFFPTSFFKIIPICNCSLPSHPVGNTGRKKVP